jgi:hypothetical protein
MESKHYIFKSFTKYSFNSTHYIHFEKGYGVPKFQFGNEKPKFLKFSFLVNLGKCH